tara:strand:+ start:1118 stop:1867 length:750 start_codon:yes stop_codon:yes gene_type:complete
MLIYVVTYIQSFLQFFLPNDGILFQTDLETGEIINRILLYEPFIGTTDNGKLQIGKTTVGDIYELYPDSRLTSTNGKNYWILDNKSISFLTKRFQEDGESPIDSSLILNRKIYLSIIRNTRANNYPYTNKCESPLYAPKNEKHTNCYTDIHKGLIHYLPIGDESAYKRVKHGHWKDFYPNHNIKEEGIYFEGEKHGEFIYYDENGALGETLTHWSKRYLFRILKYFILAIIIIWISIRVRSKIRGKNIK